jgi:hypothetical protein
MRKAWVLDTDTKGTGAQMVPLEAVEERNRKPREAPAARRREAAPKRRARTAAPAKPRRPAERTATPLAPGQVRKKSTGEIGKVLSVDPKAGTATVRWLKQGRTSTVPLSAISRR